MAISDAKPVPRRNEPYRFVFQVVDSNNNPYTSWSSPSVWLSLDCSTFYTYPNGLYFDSAPTQMGTHGIGYIDLTASGTDSNIVAIVVRIGTGPGYYWSQSFLYPEEPGDYRCNVVQVSGEFVSIDDFGGGGSSLTASDVWTHSDRTLTNLGEEAVSGDIAGAVWTALQDDYDHVSDSFGDYLDSEVSKVDASVAIDILTSQQAIQSDINAISGDITNILEDTSAISTSGLATRSQLEYWGLVILNNVGGGPVG